MLVNLLVKNLAIVKHINAEFIDGMVCLTGESGSGKSLFALSIQLLSGDRVDKGLIGSLGDEAEVIGVFKVSEKTKIYSYLLENGADDHLNCIIRRVFNQSGLSRIYVNDIPITLKQLKVLSADLMTIHSQHFYYQLLDKKTHLNFVDRLVDENLLQSIQQVARQHNVLLEVYQNTQLEAQQRLDQIELVRYQVEAFDELEVDESELEAFEKKYGQLQVIEQVQNLLSEMAYQLHEQDESLLHQLQKYIHQFSAYQKNLEFKDLTSNLDQCEALLSEIVMQVKHLRNDGDQQSERFSWMQSQMDILGRLSQKHQCSIAKLSQVKKNLLEKLDSLESLDQKHEKMHAELQAFHLEYKALAQMLCKKRVKACEVLEKRVNPIISRLHLLGIFHIQMTQQSVGEFDPLPLYGLDQIDFLICNTKNHPPKLMTEIASGGELSRLALALEVASIQKQQNHFMLFDEVDTGIGGVAAEVVGEYLKMLSGSAQIFCITHSPQVAVKANLHLHMIKRIQDDQLMVELRSLSTDQRVEVVSQMISGKNISEVTRLQARQMLEGSNKNSA